MPSLKWSKIQEAKLMAAGYKQPEERRACVSCKWASHSSSCSTGRHCDRNNANVRKMGLCDHYEKRPEEVT